MRADKFFAERYGSRTKAKEALACGLVLIGDRPVSPDDNVTGTEPFSFLARKEEYVSGGGYKLACGLDAFGVSVEGLTFADLGASTGGFTDCLLQRGARHVFCVDVGEDQLAPAIRSDPRVTVMDRTNARYLTLGQFPSAPDGVVCDLSFISLRLILPAVSGILSSGKSAYVLFKPQFECGGRGLGKSGICPKTLHRGLLSDFYDFSLALALPPQAAVHAPLREQKNIEYVVWLKKDGEPLPKASFLSAALS